eukprot:3761043-Rhodomonas_salina.2
MCIRDRREREGADLDGFLVGQIKEELPARKEGREVKGGRRERREGEEMGSEKVAMASAVGLCGL